MKARVRLDRPADLKSGGFFHLPFDPESAFGKKRAPVVVAIGAVTYRSTIATYGGKAYLPVREEIRKKARLVVGDEVDITVSLDEEERKVELPKDMKSALAKSAKAKAAWSAMSYTHHKEHVDWVTSAKKDDTRARRIAQWIEKLAKGKRA
jgi:hypothetical protein